MKQMERESKSVNAESLTGALNRHSAQNRRQAGKTKVFEKIGDNQLWITQHEKGVLRNASKCKPLALTTEELAEGSATKTQNHISATGTKERVAKTFEQERRAETMKSLSSGQLAMSTTN